MRAIVATDYGPPERYTIAELPAPEPGPDQIQVRIAAASLNPADIRLPGGDFPGLALDFPYVPGNDFAGTVTELGTGVTAYRIGDEIFGQAVPRVLRDVMGAKSLTTGTLAEYAVFEAATPLLAHRPAGLPVVQAAALATAGLTARLLMTTAEIKPGETVLVVGATGGVGTTVLPLLAAAHARVIATATATDAEIVKSLGAEAIGYGDYPSDVDVAFNLTLPGDQLTDVARALRPGGRLISIVPAPETVAGVPVRFVLDMDGTFGGMREVAHAAVGGLTAVVSRVYDLADGVRACVDFARRHTTGKLVVRM